MRQEFHKPKPIKTVNVIERSGKDIIRLVSFLDDEAGCEVARERIEAAIIKNYAEFVGQVYDKPDDLPKALQRGKWKHQNYFIEIYHSSTE